MTSDAIPQDRFRPVTWTAWLLWILLAAIEPVLSSIEATFFNMELTRGQPYAALLNSIAVPSIVFTLLAPPILQALILKRIVPKLSVWFWLGCMLLTGLVWTMMKQGSHGPDFISDGFRTVQQFRSAVLKERLAGTLSFSHVLGLPWGPLMVWAIVGSAATAILPAWMISSAAGSRRPALIVFKAAIAAGCVTAVVEQLYDIYGFIRPMNEWSLNNNSWPEIYQIIAIRAGIGAVWGAVSALVVVLLTRARPIRVALMAASAVAIAFLFPFGGYLAGPQGLRAGAPALWKSVSSSPGQDRSQGEPLLSYSHDIAATLSRYLSVAISPDSHTAIVRNGDHKLLRVDLETGRDAGAVTEPLAPLERHAVLFRPDGRFLAVQSNGDEVSVGTRYKRHQNRVRLFALPDFNQVGEFMNHDGQCFDSVAREPMLFEPDGNSLWLVCAPYNAPTADDIMAIRLEVPSLKPLEIRRFGDAAGSGMVQGLERVGDSIWAWQFPYTTAVPYRIRDLTNDREVLKLSIPAEPTANLTAQTGQSRIDDKTVKLNFCGVHSTALDAAEHFDRATSLCRTLTFDITSGALIDKTDSSDFRFAAVPSATLTGHGLRVESNWHPDTKSGETVVRDATTGQERQRIVSVAQRPLQWSPDGHWLVMYATDRNVFRVYRAKP